MATMLNYWGNLSAISACALNVVVTKSVVTLASCHSLENHCLLVAFQLQEGRDVYRQQSRLGVCFVIDDGSLTFEKPGAAISRQGITDDGEFSVRSINTSN